MIQYDYSGKVAFLTGGTSGIGLATARAFWKAGASVVLAARDAQAGREACVSIERSGGRAFFVSTDVRDEKSVSNAVLAALTRFGKIDFAVNCAGMAGEPAPLERTNQSVWDEVMAVNARGVWLAMRYEIPPMLEMGGGAVVNLCSIYGAAGKSAHHAYVASKHAVLGMSRSVALEFASRGVRVNALCAGITGTPSVKQAEIHAPELVRALVSEHPMARMATEAEIAGAALWLCSPDAGYVTGAPLQVDGGFLAA